MHNFAPAIVVALGAALVALPVARAEDQNNQQPAEQKTDSSGHVLQHQDVVPQQGQSTKPDQSAQAPGVITPPATQDRSVITPPATGAAKMPVIPPPGTPGGNDSVQPK